MKKLLNIIILIGLLIGSSNIVFAEKLPPLGYKKELNSIDNPAWYKYLYDYKDQLYKAFDARKFKEKEWGQVYIYTINKNGTITDITNYSHMNKFDTYVKQVILDSSPPPFPKEIEENKVRMDASLWSTNSDYFHLDYYPQKNSVSMMICKDRRHKK